MGQGLSAGLFIPVSSSSHHPLQQPLNAWNLSLLMYPLGVGTVNRLHWQVAGQNVTGQNVTDKMLWTKYRGQNIVDKMSRTKGRGQYVMDKMAFHLIHLKDASYVTSRSVNKKLFGQGGPWPIPPKYATGRIFVKNKWSTSCDKSQYNWRWQLPLQSTLKTPSLASILPSEPHVGSNPTRWQFMTNMWHLTSMTIYRKKSKKVKSSIWYLASIRLFEGQFWCGLTPQREFWNLENGTRAGPHLFNCSILCVSSSDPMVTTQIIIQHLTPHFVASSVSSNELMQASLFLVNDSRSK